MIGEKLRKGFLGFQRRHLIFLFGFLVIFVIGMIIFVNQSDAFKEAKRFAKEDPRITDIVGTVSYVNFGLLSDWSIDGSTAEFVFDVTGDKGEATVEIHLSKRAGVWSENAAYVKLKSDGKLRVIISGVRW